MFVSQRVLAGILSLLLFGGLVARGEEDNPALLLEEINLRALGACHDLRLGDLNGDGRLDLLILQVDLQDIRRLIALDITGRELWRVEHGSPGRAPHSDVPVQIHDWDNNGLFEVVYAVDGKLRVLEGSTGRLLREGPLPVPHANDCIAFADFAGRGHAQEIVVKDRYRQVWALDHDFSVLWTHRGNPGHYCWPHDFTGEGRDALVAGFTLLGPDGTPLWEADLPRHADAVAVGDVTGNGRDEIAIANCGELVVLLDDQGHELWRHTVAHSQHVIIGNFLPERPGAQVAALDRGTDRSASGTDAILLLDASGELLWREQRTDPGTQRWVSIISTVSGWDERPGDLIFGFRRGGSTPPTLYDGHGRPVASFPMPNMEVRNLAQHGDILGDGWTEVVVWNQDWLGVYGHGGKPPTTDPPPRPRQPEKRLYNYTYYIGMP